MRKLFALTAAWAAIAVLDAASVAEASAAEWGTLKGQVLLDGDIPDLKPLVAKGDVTARDSAVCAANGVPDEKLVVDKETKGIANVVIYLQKKPAAINPDLEKKKAAEAIFDQQGCHFIPHILLVRTDQPVIVRSGDPVAHNTHTVLPKNRNDNFLVAPNDRVGQTLKPLALPEKYPSPVQCDIHSWMKAYWVILDHPYAAVTDEKGMFEIPDLPVGKHDFIVWQESAGMLEKKWPITIKAGMNEQQPLKYTVKQILK